MLKESLILQPILHRKPVKGDCCSVIDGKLQLKHVSAAEKMTLTRIRNIKNVMRCRDSRSANTIETR